MGIVDPTSVSLGWGNVVADYGAPVNTTGSCDGAFRAALAAAQAGSGGAVVGGTVFVPFGSYTLTGTLDITEPCVLMGFDSNFTVLNFTFPDSSSTAIAISGSNVTLRGLTVNYAHNMLSSGTNVAAITVQGCSGVVLEDVTIFNPFGGVDCIDADLLCDDVNIEKLLTTPTLTAITAFGFRSQTIAGAPPGAAMRCSNSFVNPATTAGSGIAGYVSIPPYPEMLLDSCGVHYAWWGCYLYDGGSPGASGAMRLRNVNTENCEYGCYASAGASRHLFRPRVSATNLPSARGRSLSATKITLGNVLAILSVHTEVE